MNADVFFIHVPKTAGLTVRLIFAELLGFDRVLKLGAYGPGQFLTMAEFRALPPERIASSPVVTGHFAWGCQNWHGGRGELAIALREPCERVLSYLGYQRDAGGAVDTIAKLRSDPECNNGMVRRLRGWGEYDERWWDFGRDAPAEPLAELTERDFDIACRNLAAADTLLLTERFVEGCVLWRHRLGTPPLVSMHDQFHNHAARPTDAADWPADVVAELRTRNALDARLYALARARVEADIGAAPPVIRDEMAAMHSFAEALMQPRRSPLGLGEAVGLVVAAIERLAAEGRAETAVRVGYLLAERVIGLADPWGAVSDLCRRRCPAIAGEIEAARERAERWAAALPRCIGAARTSAKAAV
ncbi:MAG TPA: hypothetical protein VFA12_19325 [Stellaceae bacterium]|nr:hypothetical protein [Stellaceae bacterium]